MRIRRINESSIEDQHEEIEDVFLSMLEDEDIYINEYEDGDDFLSVGFPLEFPEISNMNDLNDSIRTAKYLLDVLKKFKTCLTRLGRIGYDEFNIEFNDTDVFLMVSYKK